MDRPHEPQHLTADQVDFQIDPSQLDFTSTEELEPLGDIVGQPRALPALDLGLGIRHASYNIYVAGLSGTGKKETIRRELARRGAAEPVLPDWIYVNHFEEPDRPLAISLPAGQGLRLKHDMEDLLERLLEELPKAFRDEDFNREKRRIGEHYQKRRRGVFEELETLAREKDLGVEQMPNGQVALVPLKDDRPMTPEEISELSEREPEGGQQQQMAMMLGMPQPSAEKRLREYRINLMVDNGRQKGAPVVIEESPNYRNLFGTIENVVDRFGKLVTDFTRIKAGALLKANGGYVVIHLLDALTEPLVWKELKRTLKSGQLKVETYDPFAIFSTSGMNPEPIPLDVKLVVLGNPLLYHLLHLYDEDFADIFKVKAEFVGEMERQAESAQIIGRFARKLSQQEGLPAIAADGVAELVRAACRLADDKDKMTAEFSRIADLAREAGYWARQEDASALITRKHICQAIDEKIYRSDWVADKIRELIREGTLRIRIDGKAVGQVNGLAVANLGDYAFGRPSRVTASVGVGAAGVINIEREFPLWEPAGNGPRDPRPTLPGRE